MEFDKNKMDQKLSFKDNKSILELIHLDLYLILSEKAKILRLNLESMFYYNRL